MNEVGQFSIGKYNITREIMNQAQGLPYDGDQDMADTCDNENKKFPYMLKN